MHDVLRGGRIIRRSAGIGRDRRRRSRAAGAHDQRHSELRQGAIFLLVWVEEAERDWWHRLDLGTLRHDELLERLSALQAERVGRIHFGGRWVSLELAAGDLDSDSDRVARGNIGWARADGH